MARILVAEDDPGIQALLQDLLERNGHETIVVGDGIAAMDEIDKGLVPDLLITDMVMPGKEGGELILEIRFQIPDIPVIAISGGLRPKTGPSIKSEFYLELAKELGAEHVIAKPFLPQDLLDCIQQVLARRMAP